MGYIVFKKNQGGDKVKLFLQNKKLSMAAFLVVLVFSLAVMIGCGGGDSGGGGGDTPSGDATITGTVYDNQGYPLEGATVSWQLSSLDKADSQKNSTTTDINGEFVLNNVSAGNITLTATKGDLACQQDLYVESGGTTVTDLDTYYSGQISGSVTDSDTQAVIASATVLLTKNDSTTVTKTTDYTGNYTFSYVPAGSHTLTISKTGYYDSTSSVTVTAGQTSTVNTALYPGTGPSPSPTTTPVFNGKVHALIIGVNDYPGDWNDLEYCVADANDFRSSFQNSSMWNDATIYYITNSEATESNILNTIATIKANASSEDRFVMTFSGHGTNTEGRAAMCVWTDDLTDWGYIDDAELASAISGMPCPSALFIDCCYSGGLIGKKLTKTVNGTVKTARVYTGAPGYNPDFKGTFNPRNVETLSNLVAVTASAGSEVSWESSSLGNGVFSYYCVEGLGSSSSVGPADTDGNNSISAEEVYDYSYSRVLSYTSNDQTPQMVDNYSSSALSVKQ